MSESLWDSGLSGLNRSCGFCMGSRSRRASKILEGQGLGHWSMVVAVSVWGLVFEKVGSFGVEYVNPTNLVAVVVVVV